MTTTNNWWRLALASVVALLLGACGGGQSVASLDPGGGIDGTGFTAGSGNGDITGFGSVLFDGSEYATNANTQFTIDGIEVVEADLRIGMVANYLLAEDVAPDLSTGTAQLIAAYSQLKGPVTSVDPLLVLGVPVLLNSNTVCDAVSCIFAPALSQGDLVTVYGFQGSDDIVRATRLELNTVLAGNLPSEWKLSGTVDATGSNSLSIGSQLVDTSGASFEDCGAAVTVGDFVTVLAAPNPVAGFTTLNQVQSVRCGQPGIAIPADVEQSEIAGRAEGIISGHSGSGDTTFQVGGQQVTMDVNSPNLVFENGTVDDLVDGARVEVEGRLDVNTRLLEAEVIVFESQRLEILAPVDPATIDLVSGSFEVMGIEVFINLATSDEVGILSGGLSVTTQLSIKAALDAGNVVAEEIRDEGTPKYDEVIMQGPLDNPLPNIAFDVLGLQINLTPATQFTDQDDQPLAGGAIEFFTLVSGGERVSVKGELLVIPFEQINAEEVELQ